MRMGKKVETLEGARDDAGKAHWYCERLLKELTDMIKKKKPKVKPQDKDPTDLTEEDLLELDNPGYKDEKQTGILKDVKYEFEVVDTVGVDYWNDWVKKIENQLRFIILKKERIMVMTKIPNNVIRPPKGYEYVTVEKNTYCSNQKDNRAR